MPRIVLYTAVVDKTGGTAQLYEDQGQFFIEIMNREQHFSDILPLRTKSFTKAHRMFTELVSANNSKKINY